MEERALQIGNKHINATKILWALLNLKCPLMGFVVKSLNCVWGWTINHF